MCVRDGRGEGRLIAGKWALREMRKKKEACAVGSKREQSRSLRGRVRCGALIRNMLGELR